jgi:hypothetical protein
MYGTPEGVAALSAQWTNQGEWLDVDIYDIYSSATVPSLTQINTWLDQVSATVDIRLADEGFQTPITDTEIVKDIAGLVEGLVKDLADYAHGSGRFYSKQSLESGLSPYMTIDKEISEWVARRSIGLVKLGVNKRDDPARSDATFEVL